MRQKPFILFLIALWGLIPLWETDTAWGDEKPIPAKKLASIFPKAKDFVPKKAQLSPDKAAAIEKEIGTKLRPEDLNPTFYVALNEEKKPMGLVLFIAVKGQQGTIDGGVGLDMNGKVVKVEVYKHKEAKGIADDKFLKPFIGKGIEDKFQVGEDVQPVAGQEEASQAVALLPKKMLQMSYALFLKRKPAAKVEQSEAPDYRPGDEDHSTERFQPEDLKEVMEVMKEEYNLIRGYFKTAKDKEAAVEAAKQLGKYIEFIADFEPPKNPNNMEEYTYFREKFHDAIHEFAESLEAEGISDRTQKQWQDIIDLVNRAHLRFSVEEIDLDEDMKEEAESN